MRPLVLRIRGLRSYRNEVEIDFRDRNLVAVIGDTGAGKSSILEAICYALYGSATWDGREVRQLISSTETALSVEFEFRADGQHWVVNRSARASGAPGIHRLECRDDPAQRFDNSTAVTTRVRELVGLDREGFLRAVVLPQGRFHQLLQATESDRNAVIKGILRVDELEQIRTLAEQAKERVSAALMTRREERARLFDDPAQVVAETNAMIATVGEAARALAAAVTAYREASDARTALVTRSDTVHGQAQAVRAAQHDGDDAAAARLASRATELDAALAALSQRLGAAEEQADVLGDALAREEAAGLGADGLAGARAVLEHALTELPQLRAERDRLQAAKQELEAADETLKMLESEVAAARTVQLDAENAVAEAERLAQDAQQALSAAQYALREARRAAVDQQGASDEAAAQDARITALAETVHACESEAAAAAEALETAVAGLEAARREDHAAAAAAGARPGDPCPVCARALPDGFTPPHSEREAAAAAAHRDAAAAERQAHARLEKARAERNAALAERDRCQSRLAAADTALREASAALAAACPGADVTQEDAVILEEVDRVAALAAADVLRARAEAGEATAAATGHSSTLAARQAERARAGSEYDAAVVRLRESRTIYERRLVGLPEPVRPARTVDVEALEAALAEVTKLQAAVRETLARRDAAIQQARALRREEQDLRAVRLREVEGPFTELRTRYALLVQALVSAAAHLEVTYEAPLSHVLPLETAATAVVTASREAERILAEADAFVAGLAGQVQEADERMAAALATTGCLSLQDLEQRRLAAEVDLAAAQKLHDEAERQLPLVRALDGQIAEASNLVDALEVVRSHLTDSKFIGFVLRRRQQILLAVASEVLLKMTNDRYGFSDDFKIVDKWSGQPRDVKTLSGGETFLASLALALGLVELAGRSGGKLDALFLDEGFGSLDANTLPDALRALEGQASGGRFVAVISHLRAVAESFDHVLSVSQENASSVARWLSAEERDRMLGNDVESGLLS